MNELETTWFQKKKHAINMLAESHMCFVSNVN